MLNHPTAAGIYRERQRRMLEKRDKEWLRQLSRTGEPPPAPGATEIASRRIPAIPGATRADDQSTKTPRRRTWRVGPTIYTPRAQ